MRRLHLTGLSVAPLSLAVLLALSAQAGVAKSQPGKVKVTAKPISSLAMDGARVAYMSGGRVYAWNVTTGTTSVVKGNYPSRGKYSLNYGEVAIAGTRVALITRFVIGNSEETTERIFTAPLGGWARQLGLATHIHIHDGTMVGNTFTGVVGSTNMLAVGSWKADEAGSSNEQLRLVNPYALRTIATKTGAIADASADHGHIALLAAGGAPAVHIYSAAGTVLSTIAPSSAKEIALSGDRLVVLTRTNTLEVYDWKTGALASTWPLAATAPKEGGHLAVYGQLATYAVDPRYAAPRTLHVLDLTTGKDVVLARATGSSGHDAALRSRGLVYAVDTPKTGKLVFVPTAQLNRLLGR